MHIIRETSKDHRAFEQLMPYGFIGVSHKKGASSAPFKIDRILALRNRAARA